MRKQLICIFILTAGILLLIEARGFAEVTAGQFFKIYDPSVSDKEKWYINDHCFVRGQNGIWHLFGITHAEPHDPIDEDNFAHATAASLTQVPWKKQTKLLRWSQITGMVLSKPSFLSRTLI